MHHEGVQNDQWIPSVCYMCYNCCGILVHLVDGVVTKIEGDPDNPHNRGRLCAKGNAGIMGLYNPNRVLTPLKRTNPEKGIGVNPKWVEISWGEALDTVVAKLKKIREDDPRKLLLAAMDFQAHKQLVAFALAFGTPNMLRSSAYYCGNGLHPITYLTHGSCYFDPDLKYCNYLLLIGTGTGFMVHSNAVTLTQETSDARMRGMRVVVVDPVGTNAASKADEWVPIRPGTDAALALGILNVLINDLEIYDEDFLKRHTNAPYLVGKDGRYMREPGTGKPLVWDALEGRAKPWDDSALLELSITGKYEVDGQEATPAFQKLKDHVKKYTPECVSKITTVPPETIRRVAKEFGEAARIGSKIVIDGKELPYRPACVNFGRGSIAHKHAFLSGFAMQLLNMVVGAIDVPGGILGCSPMGPSWAPKEGPDGLLVTDPFATAMLTPFPPRPVKRPQSLDLLELFPVACYSTPMMHQALKRPDDYGVPLPEALLHCRTNVMMTSVNPGEMAEILSRIPFQVSFACDLDETVEFADIVFPDAHYLERLDPVVNIACEWIQAGPGSWYWETRQPVVKAAPGVKHWVETLLAIVDRLGLRSDYNNVFNLVFGLAEPYKLNPEAEYTWEEMADKVSRAATKSTSGSEWGLESFKDRTFMSSPKSIEEAYPTPFCKPRIPIYLEYLLDAGSSVRKVTEEMGLVWDTSDYQPIPDWKPCPAHDPASDGTLYAVNYKLPFHTFSQTGDNPWLDDVGRHHSYAYKIMLNAEVARKSGISDGDLVWVEETSKGYKVRGRVKVTECVHPEVVAIAGVFGHWAMGQKVARGKGVNFNTLLPSTMERIDMVGAALDSCVRVRVYK